MTIFKKTPDGMRSRTDSTASKALLQCALSVDCGCDDDDDDSLSGSDSLNISLVVDDDDDDILARASRCE